MSEEVEHLLDDEVAGLDKPVLKKAKILLAKIEPLNFHESEILRRDMHELGGLLHQAVNDRNLDTYNGIHHLMQFGPPIDFRDNHNNTPLHHAVKVFAPKVVKVLLFYGAALHLKDSNNETALEMAHATAAKLDSAHAAESLGDACKCITVLEAAEDANPFRVNARVTVRMPPFEDHDLGRHMTGTGILQHWHKKIEKWRVTFEDGRWPAFIDPMYLSIAA